jgi:hypothetical protein
MFSLALLEDTLQCGLSEGLHAASDTILNAISNVVFDSRQAEIYANTYDR